MSSSPDSVCVLVVADSEDVGKLVEPLAEPLPTRVAAKVEVIVTAGGDDTIDTFIARKPPVAIVCNSLVAGDAASLIEALRGMVGKGELGIVVIGDRQGPASIAAGVAELQPDAFVGRPIVARALRYAVASSLERVLRARGAVPSGGTSPGTDPNLVVPAVAPVAAPAGEPAEPAKSAQRARWEALADSLVEAEPVPDELEVVEAAPLPSPPPPNDPWMAPDASAPTREPTLILRDPDPVEPPTMPITAPARTPTVELPPVVSRTPTIDPPPPPGRTTTGDNVVDMIERKPGGEWSEPMPLSALGDRDSKRDLEEVTVERGPSGRSPTDDVLESLVDDNDVIESIDSIDDFGDDDLVIGDDILDRPTGGTRPDPAAAPFSSPAPRLEVVADPGPPQRDFARQLRAKMSQMAQRLFQGSDADKSGSIDLKPHHDHHTEIDLASLGEEMPLGGGVTEIESRAAQRPVEPRDQTTSPGSFDTAQLRERGLPDGGEIVRGVSDAAMLVARMFATGATGRVTFKRQRTGEPTPVTQTGQSAATHVLPLVEKTVYFDQGRPVFASSSEPRDRMGELLVREGKITASQYERCQTVVAESGRRMGEILVDFGYLKRRELLPAVRRHVEDIVYSLFGWDRGQYMIAIDPSPSAERIRLSRHPAALVLEGIRRKLDRSTLERLIGPPSTIIEVADRERLNAVINTGNTGDLGQEERAALAAIDGQADLSQVARTAGVDLADVLPLAWGLCVLGLASARRTDTEVPDESTALVGETDLAIDRERVRARWQLVTEADYFALLGVRRDATAFEIRRAYQSARRDFASDTFPADLRRELAQELDDIAHVLDEAFRVLRDDRLRGTYLANLIE